MRPRCIPSTATTTTGSRAGCGAALGCPQNAADLAQDTFVKVLVSRQAARIDEPRAFLTTIARRVLCSHYRRQDVERAYRKPWPACPSGKSPAKRPAPSSWRPWSSWTVCSTVCRHWPEETFLLAQLDGLGYAEIATQLGISLSSVKRYMLKAAQRCYFAELP